MVLLADLIAWGIFPCTGPVLAVDTRPLEAAVEAWLI